jgi:hypothetical protein
MMKYHAVDMFHFWTQLTEFCFNLLPFLKIKKRKVQLPPPPSKKQQLTIQFIKAGKMPERKRAVL